MPANTGTHSFLTDMAGFLTDTPASMLSLVVLTNAKGHRYSLLMQMQRQE